jgi:elongation factor P
LFKSEPYLVTEREFVNPGKGSAFVRLKLKNVKTGLVIRETVKSQDSVEEVTVDTVEAQFLYTDSQSLIFMDSTSYEQHAIPMEGTEGKKPYLKEGESYQLVVWGAEAIDIKLPLKIVLTVAHAEDAIKGDTVSGTTKLVTLETGLRIKVPLFIKTDDKILVNTETGEYVERANP